jgi:carbon starvation protein
VARFVFQETLAQFSPKATIGHKPKWALNVLMSVVVCFAWGFLLYIGNLDTLWKMLGVANQLLASIALIVGTTYLLRNAPKRIYALCTGIPLVFVLVTVMTAGVMNVLAWFRSAGKTSGTESLLLLLAGGMGTLILGLTVIIALDAIRRWWITLRTPAGALEPARVPVEE